MERRDNLKRLLNPRHIAFVGGRGVADAVRQCRMMGFQGETWVVNPTHPEIAGHRCYPSIEALPAAPDAAFVGVPREATVAVVTALAARGAGGCICYAAGFAEAGGDGVALQAELVAASGALALVGPNCYGLLNYLDGVALFPAPHGGARAERGVAILSQSGNVGLNLTWNDRSVPLAYVISVGNQAVLDLSDYLGVLLEDPRVTAIGLYLEGLGDIPGFAAAAAAAIDKGVPIVALKVGTSEIGAQMTLSHTTALSGPEELYQALFDRLAIVRVGSLPALLETLKLLAISGPPQGRRLGVLTASGGDAALVADLAARAGLEIPPLLDGQTDAFREQLASFAAISNPLDYNNPLWGDAPGLERCFSTMMEGEVEQTLLILDYPREGGADWDVACDAFIAAKRRTGRRAVVASTLPEGLPRTARERLMAEGIAPLQGLDELRAALGGAAWYADKRRAIAARGGTGGLRLPEPNPLPATRRILGEHEGKRWLAAFGVGVPEGRLASAADAADAADQIGFPVVVKAVAETLVHKTEVDAIRLDLHARDAVARAVTDIDAALAGSAHAADRYLIERMVVGATVELIVSVTRDPRFGMALVIGCGGVLVNLVADSRTLLLPTERGAIGEALDTLRVSYLLTGFRGGPPGDRAAALDAIEAIAAMALDFGDRLIALDVNPLAVLALGEGAVAVDAMICLAD